MRGRPLLNTREHSAAMKSMHNADEEDRILRRYAFHEARSKLELMRTYTLALDMLFREVPSEQWDAVMGRLGRKLIKQRKVLEGMK